MSDVETKAKIMPTVPNGPNITTDVLDQRPVHPLRLLEFLRTISLPMLFALTVLYLITFAIPIAILITIMSPITYEAAPNPTENWTSTSIGISRNEWPFKSHVRFFACDNPTPNFDVTEEQLIAVWNLPPKSRLLLTMRVVAHCKLASNWLNSKGIYFDSQECECHKYEYLWIYIIFMNAVSYCILNLCSCHKVIEWLWSNRPICLRLDMWRLAWLWTSTSGMLWFFGIYPCIFLRRSGAGFYYLYGDMYPRAYYNEPFSFVLINLFCWINLVSEVIKLHIFSFILITTKNDSEESVVWDKYSIVLLYICICGVLYFVF